MLNPSRKFKYLVEYGLLFAAAIACQFIFQAILPAGLRGNDSLDYNEYYAVIAEKISNGVSLENSWYFSDSNENTKHQSATRTLITNWPPGYPVILSQLFVISNIFDIPKYNLVMMFIALTYALTSLVVFSISMKFTDVQTSLLAATIWMSYPFNLWLAKQPNSEVPFMLVLYTAILCFLNHLSTRKLRHLFLSAVLLAAATYIRAISFFLPIIFIFIIIQSSNYKSDSYLNKKQILTFILIYITLLSPWIYFVYRETGAIIPMASSASKLSSFTMNHMLTSTALDGTALPKDIEIMLSNSLKYVSEMNPNESGISTIKIIYYNFSNDPITSIKYLLLKISRTFYGTDSRRHEIDAIKIQLLYFAVLVFGLPFLLNRHFFKSIYNYCIILILMYFITICIIGFPILRYSIPALGLLSPYLAMIIARYYRIFR